jgi:hypothetical protein
METIFDFLQSLLFTKKKIQLGEENLAGYSPYMINRWCSFYSTNLVSLINLSVNRYHQLSKFEHYNLLFCLFSKLFFKRIAYIKKKDLKKDNNDDLITLLAKNLEISKREINLYITCQQYQ